MKVVEPTDREPKLRPPQIGRLLDQGIASAVAQARQTSPFYKRKLAGLPKVQNAADLQNLPITTKHEVSSQNQEFWSIPQNQVLDICTTSGTTGVPTLYPLTDADLDRLAHNEFLCFRRVGLARRDKVLLAVTMDKCFMAGLAYFEGLRRIGAAVVRLGAGSPAMLLSMVDRIKPTAIISVPSFLQRVAGYANQYGHDLARSTVAKLICIGEPVREKDFSLTPLAESISQAWDAKIFSTYGITELACSLCECKAGNGGHLHPELLHIEILDESGRPVADGDEGELVATTIGVQAMPLIRFATGDITFIERRRCSCGLWTPRIGPILGRKDQVMKIKGTTVYPAAVQRALQQIESIVDYILVATSPTPLSDELEVIAAWSGEVNGAADLIREKLRGELKVAPAVRITDVAEIQALGNSRELRKQRVFLDLRHKSSSLR